MTIFLDERADGVAFDPPDQNGVRQPRLDPEPDRALDQLLADIEVSVSVEPGVESPQDCSVLMCHQYLRAGNRLRVDNSYCSSNFAYRFSPNDGYYSTAGHCDTDGATGDAVRYGDATSAQSIRSHNYHGDVDLALIPWSH